MPDDKSEKQRLLQDLVVDELTLAVTPSHFRRQSAADTIQAALRRTPTSGEVLERIDLAAERLFADIFEIREAA